MTHESHASNHFDSLEFSDRATSVSYLMLDISHQIRRVRVSGYQRACLSVISWAVSSSSCVTRKRSATIANVMNPAWVHTSQLSASLLRMTGQMFFF